MQRPQRSTAYLIALSGLLSYLLNTASLMCPRMALLTVGWAFPHQSLLKKIPYRLVYKPNLIGGIFSG